MAKTPKIPPGKPEVFQLEPRGIQRGVTSRIKLIGTNLIALTELKLPDKFEGELLEEPVASTNEAWIELTAQTNLTRGPYEISVKNTNSESSKIKLYVDDLPQVDETQLTNGQSHTAFKLPLSFWGTLDPSGDKDAIEIEANEGDAVVFDLAAKSMGSKAVAMLNVFDEEDELVASNNGFDGGDPLLQLLVPRSGRYRVQINQRVDGGSKDHFYRLSIGTFPVVVGCFPLSVPVSKESNVELIGLNIPAKSTVTVKPTASGEAEVPVDLERFRNRRSLKVLVNDGPELVENEPNDSIEQAMNLAVPGAVNGRFWQSEQPVIKKSRPAITTGHSPLATSPPDVDLFKFDTKRGQKLVIETTATRRGSPADTKIEVLQDNGKPVERLLLQAVRDSHLTFRPIDSVTDDLRVENWQEMELNQLMYLEGEVCKIFRMPQGPDSGFQFYNAGGKRRNYFDTSGIAHALDEALYIVEPHPPGTRLVPNGLPTFTLYYANDDDGDRKLGADSRMLFSPPEDGTYVVRVTETRGHSGERFCYRLVVREAQPDFKVTLNGANPTINAGSGKEFSVSADRIDGFDEDITVEITGLPEGVGVSTPVVIQSGHLEAKGTLHAAMDASAPAETNQPSIKIVATATVNGKPVTKEVNTLGKIKLVEKPKLLVALEPYDPAVTNFVERSILDKPFEVNIAPGQSIPAWLKIKRNGHEDLVTFSVEGLPHGVIVDNIGLNGVLIPKGQDQRQIFLTAAKWVPETDRLCFAQAKQADNPTSLPVLLHVRRNPATQAASGK